MGYTVIVGLSIRRQKEAGSSLGTILVVTGVVALLVFALASSSVTHLHLSHRSTNAQVAETLAESAIAAGLEKVLQEPEFGVLEREEDRVDLPGSDIKSKGFLTFNPADAQTRQTFHSTNNLKGDSSRSGSDGRVVPANSLHLVGTGECNGVNKKIEAIFHVPKFPFVIAAGGRFTTDGETVIGSIESVDEWLASGQKSDDLQPGHVASNSEANDAIVFGPLTRVTGDAKARGGVELQSGATVMGEIRPNASPAEIPSYSVKDFDPLYTGRLDVSTLNQSNLTRPNLEGWVRRDGDLFVSQGLHLDNGVLYVNGNLTVSGGVTGTGAILVTGTASVTGKSSFATDNLAAIMAEGHVNIRGSGTTSSVFRGLIYSNESLHAENITLIGTVLSAGKTGELILKDSTVLYSPDSVALDLEHSARTGLNFVAPSGSKPGTFLGTKGQDKSVHSKTRIYVSIRPDGKFLIYPEGSSERDAKVASSESEAREIIRTLVAGEDGETLKAFDNTTEPKLTTLLADLRSGSVTPEEEAVDLISLDPSTFIALADKVRLVLLREL